MVSFTWYPINVSLEGSGVIDRIKAFLLSHSVIYAKIQNYFQKFLGPSNFIKRNPIFEMPLRDADLSLFRDTIARIVEYLREKKITVILVKQPLLSFYKTDAERKLIAAKLGAEVFKRYSSLFKSYLRYLDVFDKFRHNYEGVVVADGFERFNKVNMTKRIAMYNDIVHLSAYGNKILAKEIGMAVLHKINLLMPLKN